MHLKTHWEAATASDIVGLVSFVATCTLAAHAIPQGWWDDGWRCAHQVVVVVLGSALAGLGLKLLALALWSPFGSCPTCGVDVDKRALGCWHCGDCLSPQRSHRGREERRVREWFHRGSAAARRRAGVAAAPAPAPAPAPCPKAAPSSTRRSPRAPIGPAGAARVPRVVTEEVELSLVQLIELAPPPKPSHRPSDRAPVDARPARAPAVARDGAARDGAARDGAAAAADADAAAAADDADADEGSVWAKPLWRSSNCYGPGRWPRVVPRS